MIQQQNCDGSVSNVDLLSVLNNINTNVARGIDTSAAMALSVSLVPLPPAACKTVTLINPTTLAIQFTSNGGSLSSLPPNAALTLSVSNANLISAKGSGELSYIINN